MCGSSLSCSETAMAEVLGFGEAGREAPMALHRQHSPSSQPLCSICLGPLEGCSSSLITSEAVSKSGEPPAAPVRADVFSSWTEESAPRS